MKNLIQWIFGLFGAKLIRAKYARKYLPKACVDNIEIVVHFYKLTGQKINLLQIGACDGVTSDSIYSYIKSDSINAYLVEPSHVNFKKLKEFYKDEKNATLINVAIADKDEKRNFYSVKDEGRWKEIGWARQLASFYKDHLLKHGILENEINTEVVECSTIKSLISKHNILDLDIILIDTEGYDGEIVKMALNENILPNFIAFENGQIIKLYTQRELNDLYDLLSRKGYVWTHDRINTLAIRKDFLALALK
jgi:FkbM family methyltransferase